MKPDRLCAALLIWAVAGCGSVPYDVTAPAVSLADVGILGTNQYSQPIALALRISNPNPQALEIEGAHFTVAVNGRQFARSHSDQPFTLPPQSDMLVEFSAESTLREVLREIDIGGSAGGLHYEVSGELLLGGYGALPFHREGRIGSRLALPAQRQAYF